MSVWFGDPEYFKKTIMDRYRPSAAISYRPKIYLDGKFVAEVMKMPEPKHYGDLRGTYADRTGTYSNDRIDAVIYAMSVASMTLTARTKTRLYEPREEPFNWAKEGF